MGEARILNDKGFRNTSLYMIDLMWALQPSKTLSLRLPSSQFFSNETKLCPEELNSVWHLHTAPVTEFEKLLIEELLYS